MFDALAMEKAKIETAVGMPLLWERLDDRRVSRIAARRQGATIDDPPKSLESLQAWGVTTMIQFANIFRPMLSGLKRALPGVSQVGSTT